MAKYHIGLDGMPKPCRAKIKCRLGTITDHFNTVDDAQAVADNLNEQLATATGFGIATNGNWQRVDKRTETAVARLANLRVTMKRLENIKNNARAEILEEMQKNNVSSLKLEDVGTLSSVAAGKRTSVDVDQLKEKGLYEDYLKATPVSDYARVVSEDNEKLKRFEQRMVTPSGKAINFSISYDENGNATVNEETKESLKKLHQFEKTLEETKKLEKELKEELMKEMKFQGVQEVNIGATKLEYVPSHERLIVDTKRLKDHKLYDENTKQTETAPSLRIKFV